MQFNQTGLKYFGAGDTWRKAQYAEQIEALMDLARSSQLNVREDIWQSVDMTSFNADSFDLATALADEYGTEECDRLILETDHCIDNRVNDWHRENFRPHYRADRHERLTVSLVLADLVLCYLALPLANDNPRVRDAITAYSYEVEQVAVLSDLMQTARDALAEGGDQS